MPVFYVTSLSPSIIPIAPSAAISYVSRCPYCKHSFSSISSEFLELTGGFAQSVSRQLQLFSGFLQVVLNEYTPSRGNLPEVRTGDHLAKLPYNFREPVYLKKVVLLNDQFPGYFHHVLVLFSKFFNVATLFLLNRISKNL